MSWSPAVPGVGQQVTFESTSEATGIGNDIVDYRWDFKIRKGQEPLREDACLVPGSFKPVVCPAG